MRRTNVILDEKLLEEAVRLSGERTYSATINRALQELVRGIKIEEGLKILSGSGWWEGNLEEMRRDREFESPDQFKAPIIRAAPAASSKLRRKKSRRGPG
jgi:Arc/MetJ family transcription regulator